MTLCWGFVSLVGEGSAFGIFCVFYCGLGYFELGVFYVCLVLLLNSNVLVLKQVFRLKMFLMLKQESHSNPRDWLTSMWCVRIG